LSNDLKCAHIVNSGLRRRFANPLTVPRPNHFSPSRSLLLSLNQPHALFSSFHSPDVVVVPHGNGVAPICPRILVPPAAPVAPSLPPCCAYPISVAPHAYIPDSARPRTGTCLAFLFCLITSSVSTPPHLIQAGYPSLLKWDATLLPPRLPLLLPHSSARLEHQHPRLASLRLIHTPPNELTRMPTQVRIFTSPRSLDETLAVAPEASQTPRSVPEYPRVPQPTISPTLKARQYTMSSYEDKPKGGVTFASQDKLPKLPIPDLEQTCQRYLAALKPLQSNREHADTKHAVQEFLTGEGPELNEKLKRYAEARTSYIEQFCRCRLVEPPTPSCD
jgi:hypothetical protein